jgi:hypothetical protein
VLNLFSLVSGAKSLVGLLNCVASLNVDTVGFILNIISPLLLISGVISSKIPTNLLPYVYWVFTCVPADVAVDTTFDGYL